MADELDFPNPTSIIPNANDCHEILLKIHVGIHFTSKLDRGWVPRSSLSLPAS